MTETEKISAALETGVEVPTVVCADCGHRPRSAYLADDDAWLVGCATVSCPIRPVVKRPLFADALRIWLEWSESLFAWDKRPPR